MDKAQDIECPPGWSKDKEWWGNPSLGLDSYTKLFTLPSMGTKVPVHVLGKYPDISFCVHAGPNSIYSHTGCFFPLKPDFQEFMEMVDKRYKSHKLFR